MWRVQAQRRRIAGGTASASTVPIVLDAAVSGMRRQRQWDLSRPMPGAFTICMEMCGNGCKIAIKAIMAYLLQTDLRGSLRTVAIT